MLSPLLVLHLCGSHKNPSRGNDLDLKRLWHFLRSGKVTFGCCTDGRPRPISIPRTVNWTVGTSAFEWHSLGNRWGNRDPEPEDGVECVEANSCPLPSGPDLV